MAMYAWDELLTRWESERLAIEQVIGQLLQHEQQSQATLQASQRRQDALEQALAVVEYARKRVGRVEGVGWVCHSTITGYPPRWSGRPILRHYSGRAPSGKGLQ